MQNPYNKPAARLESVATFDNDGIDPDAATFQPALFSVDGRIGRLRYLAYSTAMGMMLGFGIGLLGALLLPLLGENNPKQAVLVFTILFWGLALLATFIPIKRRLNDLDHTGWLALLLLVPLVNLLLSLYLILWPGSPGHNSYGPRPVPNSLGVVLTAVVPIMALIVISVAVWSYVQMNPGALSALSAATATR
jgi:uncharacterized membrane protein YhaH (DUF805 family)